MPVTINGSTGITSPGGDVSTSLTTGSVTTSGTNSVAALTVNSNNISAVNSLGFRNRIINGDMRVDQRNAGASVTPTVDFTYTLDRYSTRLSVASKYSVQQNAGAITLPTGFTNYLGVTSSSAYSISTSDYFGISQRVEGFNVSDFGWGTASAQSVTLSFWVRSSLTGTFGVAFVNSANNRAYPATYTILAANTWEQKTVTIAGDTSGTWLTNNGIGIQITWGLGYGVLNSATANAWNAGTGFMATGATSVVGTNGATFYITGVQLEAGTVATPFERRDYGRELMMCQRYFNKINSSGVLAGIATYTAPNTATMNVIMPVTPRATPSISYTGNLVVIGNGTSITMSGSAGSIGTATPAYVQFTLTATGIVANVPHLFYVSSGTVDFSSEL